MENVLTIDNMLVRPRVATGGGAANTFFDGEVSQAVSMINANAVSFEITALTKLQGTSTVDVLLQQSNDGFTWHNVAGSQLNFAATGVMPLRTGIGMAFVRAVFLIVDSNLPGTPGVILSCTLTTSLQ